jgi:hypothetical protein
MRKRWMIFSLLVFPLLLFLLLTFMALEGRSAASLHAENGDVNVPLPVIIVLDPTDTPTPMPSATATATATPTDTPTPEPSVINGSFEEGWTDVAINVQEPNNWDLYRIPDGEPLFDSTNPDDVADGSCECIHKLNSQLRPDEQIGGPNALILEGLTVYKFQGAHHKWGSELSQTVENLTPGSNVRLTVPIQIHHQTEYGAWDAESGVWVNEFGYWANSEQMPDREWCKHEQVFEVPSDGRIDIDIRVKVKYANPKDFFVDDIQLTSASEPAPYADMDLCREDAQLIEYQPARSRK